MRQMRRFISLLLGYSVDLLMQFERNIRQTKKEERV